MFHKIQSIISNSINAIIEYAYSGNINAFRIEPIWGNIIAIGFMAFVDRHIWQVAQFVGTILLTLITVGIGTFAPMIYRYTAHKMAVKYPIIGEILKHDKKDRT